MLSSRIFIVSVLLLPLVGLGCSSSGKRSIPSAGWSRPYAVVALAQKERSCLRSGAVRPNRFISYRSSLGGSFAGCGAIQPFVMSAALDGAVTLHPPAVLRCPMIPTTEQWIEQVVRPAARRRLGADLVRIEVAGSYSCRTRNSIPGARMSEHGRANALDVRGFVLSDGRVVTVKKNWRGPRGAALFLRDVHDGACRLFTTVLGPKADRYHHDHFHLDLAQHSRTGRYRVCQ